MQTPYRKECLLCGKGIVLMTVIRQDAAVIIMNISTEFHISKIPINVH
jgi:hypothetical protein